MRIAITFICSMLFALFITGCENDENIKIEQKYTIGRNYSMEKVCIDGYVYAALKLGFGAGLTQVWENTINGPRLVECKKEITNK